MAEWSKALDLSLIFSNLKVFKFSRESVGSNPTFGIIFVFFSLLLLGAFSSVILKAMVMIMFLFFYCSCFIAM